MRFRALPWVLFSLLGLTGAACSDAGDGGADDTGAGGASAAAAATAGIGGSNYNECGVAAPLPVDANAQCTAVIVPTITNFDDYSGNGANNYVYYINAKPPAQGALRGAVMHVGDGSDANGGTSMITTEMVVGQGDAGYALQIANTNAVNWGGLSMFYFPGDATTSPCLDAREYAGLEFSIRGSAASGRFGVTIGMRDTIPKADRGLCDNANASDCKDATIELTLPSDATAWKKVQLPWSTFTPGVGSGRACVPLTGQNIMRIVIQPFMSYPPPNYVLEPGPYSLEIDDLRFF